MNEEDIEFQESFCFLETYLSLVTWIRPISYHLQLKNKFALNFSGVLMCNITIVSAKTVTCSVAIRNTFRRRTFVGNNIPTKGELSTWI